MDEYLDNLPLEVEARLIEAVDGLVEGSLDAKLLAQVEQDLKQYRAARELLNSICLQRSMLLDYFREENTITGQDYADLALKISEINLELAVELNPEKDLPKPSAQPKTLRGFLQKPRQFLSGNALAVSIVFLISTVLLTASYFAITFIDRHFGGAQSAVEIVAQITDAKDCRWAANASPAAKLAQLPLGRRLDLEKGLVQITYSNGAAVLLEGPASFTLDSSTSGFLAHGRLSVRADTEPSHGFTVATANARFTDLGTEFGVKSDAQNNAEVHVFRGAVALRDTAHNAAVRLAQGKAARIDANSHVEYLPQADPNEFVLQMDKPRKKQLDLLDIVSGGDGFNAAWRESGIETNTGNQDSLDLKGDFNGIGGYHRVSWQPLVDGVFIPAGNDTQLDSTGHAYDFPKTDGMGWKGILARHKTSDPGAYPDAGSGDEYMPSGRGTLGIHANAGITFDLAAMRKAHPGWMPVKFTATAGNLFDIAKVKPPHEYTEKADVWVFVDGQLRFQRSQLGHADGPIPVEVPLAPTDRFLTLVTTDGVGVHYFARMLFGDPVLKLEAGP